MENLTKWGGGWTGMIRGQYNRIYKGYKNKTQ